MINKRGQKLGPQRGNRQRFPYEPRVTRPELGSLTVGTVVLTGAGRFLIAAVAPQARADRFEQG